MAGYPCCCDETVLCAPTPVWPDQVRLTIETDNPDSCRGGTFCPNIAGTYILDLQPPDPFIQDAASYFLDIPDYTCLSILGSVIYDIRTLHFKVTCGGVTSAHLSQVTQSPTNNTDDVVVWQTLWGGTPALSGDLVEQFQDRTAVSQPPGCVSGMSYAFITP